MPKISIKHLPLGNGLKAV